MARNGKIRSKLNHNKIKEIVEKKPQATCSKCLKQVNGAVDFFFQMHKNQKLHCIATIAANGFWDIFTKKGIDIKKISEFLFRFSHESNHVRQIILL